MTHFAEPLLAGILAIVAIASKLLFLAVATGTEKIDAMQWSLLPLIGALLASGGAFMLNAKPEDRRTVAGRAIFACVFGVTMPKLLSIMHPWLQEATVDPILVILFGFLSGLIGYILSRPLVTRLFQRAPRMADEQIDAAYRRFGAKPPSKPTNSEPPTP